MENKISKIDVNEINRKNGIVDNAIKVLKSEFVGIDKQIDEVMYNVRTWYLYPQLQSRPLVVNIWGLSGTGKTQLVKRISQLLDIEKDYVYFNFGSISESTSWEIENEIEEQLSNENSKRIFVYDEFQYAATKNPSNGEERDTKSGLKPFWELLDSGIIHKRNEFNSIRIPHRILDYMSKINHFVQMKIENGVWVNADECLGHFSEYDISKFRQVFNFTLEYKEKTDDEVEDGSIRISRSNTDNYDFFIREGYLERLLDLYQSLNNKINDEIELYHKLKGMTYEEFFEFVLEIYGTCRKGYDLKFNDSIIFVIGNLDEAYQMSFNVNPDMSPDQFRKMTENITVVDIKDALRVRFRSEQIARLGNIHVIYPSFSSDNFRELIDMSLNAYKEEVKELTNYNLVFDQTIKDIIYDEGVFPTHGTRPIFSTVHEIVKSRLPETIQYITANGKEEETETIVYSFNGADDTFIATALNDKSEELCRTTFETHLRLKKLRDSGVDEDEQSLCALHESGHFVMYTKLFGKMPEKLVSRTTETDTGGFLMEDINDAKKKISKNDRIKEIMVLLGGYVAEKLFFENEMSSGASHDLEVATKLASKMIRRYGFGEEAYVTTYMSGSVEDTGGYFVKDDVQEDINAQIKDILEFAKRKVTETFQTKEWKAMLKESALYLCDNSAMPKEKMQEIYDKVSDTVKLSHRKEGFYRNAIENM